MLLVTIYPKSTGETPIPQATTINADEIHFLNGASYGNLFDKGESDDVLYIWPENVAAVKVQDLDAS